MITTSAQASMSAEADAVCSDGYGVRSDARTNIRNGYRHKESRGRHDRLDDPEAALGQLLPGLAA